MLFEDCNLNPNSFVGLGTDGENKMAGEGGLQGKLKEKYPWIVFVKCIAHGCDNSSKQANVVMPSDVLKLVTECYNWFAHSALRQSRYKETLKKVGFDKIDALLHDDDETEYKDDGKQPPLRLISTSVTRWLVIADCIERFIQQVNWMVGEHSSLDECSP